MRKAIIMAALAAGLSCTLEAQAPLPAEIVGTVQIQGPAITDDTVTTYLDRMTQSVVLFNSSAGYLLGTGTEFKETAVHYDALGQVKVTELMVFFGPRAVIGSPDTLWAHFYTAGVDSMPFTTVSSGSFRVQDLNPMGFASYIPVQGAGFANGGFLVSVTHPGNDTISILSTSPGGDGLGEKRTRQATIVNIWKRSHSFWTVDGLPYDGDALILPIIEFTPNSIPSQVAVLGLGLKAPYPLPASNEVHLPFETNHAGAFVLRVYDATGRMVQAVSMPNRAPGTHAFDIETSGWACGTYHYTVEGPRAVLAGKFQIMR